MKYLLPEYLLLLILYSQVSCTSGQPGCTDPLAINYDREATQDDHSCIYQIPQVEPSWTLDLDRQLSETSGLMHWDGYLWTHNDDTDTRLYQLNPGTAEIVGNYMLPGVVNQDWEEIDRDDEFIYVGDFGNNMGYRDNLNILRVELASMSSGSPSIDSISFTYSDQESLVSSGLNQTEFDCEAFVVGSDSIYLFSKQWLSGLTTQYVLPKTPGIHMARKRESFNIQGLVTGATYMEDERLLVLCGYAGYIQPFVYLFYAYTDDAFFSGTGKRVNIGLPFHQVEAVHTIDGLHFYLSNERVQFESYLDIPQQLHMVDLSEFLVEYLKEK
ncbi:MAG: hypothetical protein P1P86_12740 [Bacteroidales bacterium]|nr:hypothetical protein [Bacteroidales bacterium]